MDVAKYYLIPVYIAGFIYVIRKIREYQWGWVRSNSTLKDKIFIITGANCGLGYETTRALIMRDATVIMACRDLARATEAIYKIRQITGSGELIPIELDLASFSSIREFAETIKRKYPKFDCLINNAGIGTNKKQWTKENYEIHFGVNYLGHFLLTKLLENNIRENNSRIVIVSSKMHEYGKIDFGHLGQYNDDIPTGRRNVYYSNSKLANFYFARELYKKGYDCHVLCPGLCLTEFFRDYAKWYHYILFSPILWLMVRSAEQGAQNIIYCATDNVNDDKKNPFLGYYVRSLKQQKSKVNFDEEVSEKLWAESIRMTLESSSEVDDGLKNLLV